MTLNNELILNIHIIYLLFVFIENAFEDYLVGLN
jgi:hypothetical protein